MKFLMQCPFLYLPGYLMNLLYFRGKPDAAERAKMATMQLYVSNQVAKRERKERRKHGRN